MSIQEKRSRILALDLLRGYFLLVVIVDHVGFFPSLFEFISGRGQLWASAAEGFFIISGLLVGYIYGPRMVHNARHATLKIWQRAFLLYALTVVLSWLFVWWGNHSDIACVKAGLWTQPALGEFLWKTLTLQYYYGWADFLPYYATFMLYAPLAVYACTRGLGWLVIAASAALWLMRGGNFELSWQILFMTSLVAGWYLPQIESWARALPARVKCWAPRGVYAAALLLVVASVLTIRVADDILFGYAHFSALPAGLQHLFEWLDQVRQWATPLIDKWTLAPLRLGTAVVWFVALYIFVRRHERDIDRLTHGLIRSLGERSLVVYVVHAFVIFALLLVAHTEHGFLANTLLEATVIGAIYVVSVYWSRVYWWASSLFRAWRGELEAEHG